MNISTVRRPTLPATFLMALMASSNAMAMPSAKAVEVLTDRAALQGVVLPTHARAQSAVTGTVNPGAFSAATLQLTLADGQKVVASLQRVARDDKKGVQSWIGTFADAPGSSLVLTKAKGAITGVANYKNNVLELVPTKNGKHVLFEVNTGSLPPMDGVVRQTAGGDTGSTSSDYGLGSSTLAAGDSVVQDVLVVYTAASAGAYGQASLESMIQTAVQSANQAYQNSQIGITLNVVGLQQVSITESSSMESTLSALQSNAAVKSLRDSVAADMVVLVSQDSNWCGYANLMTSNSTTFAPAAYSVVYSGCLSNQSLAHELGHLQGLDHDRANQVGGGVYDYSYGYALCVSGGFRDIMSYPCAGVPRVLLFSNPYVNYNGYPSGISYEANKSAAAENARSLNNTATTVAAFRTSGGSVASPMAPAAPSALVSTSVVYNKITLAWADNAGNESGYKIERSADGVNFAEVGSMGADATSFADVSVSALSNYYYRVRAFNSVGVSAYSNIVSVATPELPPPPPVAPSSIVAADQANGTALVQWASDTVNVANFEVLRETWDSRKKVWSRAATAGVVPATMLSMVDTTGSGTYRYFVRANNAGGASPNAGPAQVLVTGGKKGPGRR